jgi:hypothetical protein
MTNEEIQNASATKLLSHVFGKKQGQTLAEFSTECKAVRDDAAFIEEVRAYALANNSES